MNMHASFLSGEEVKAKRAFAKNGWAHLAAILRVQPDCRSYDLNVSARRSSDGNDAADSTRSSQPGNTSTAGRRLSVRAELWPAPRRIGRGHFRPHKEWPAQCQSAPRVGSGLAPAIRG